MFPSAYRNSTKGSVESGATIADETTLLLPFRTLSVLETVLEWNVANLDPIGHVIGLREVSSNTFREGKRGIRRKAIARRVATRWAQILFGRREDER